MTIKSTCIRPVLYTATREMIMYRVNCVAYEKTFAVNHPNFVDPRSKLCFGTLETVADLRFVFSQAHQPFVFNDLRPYFDTSSVERAIYSVSERRDIFAGA